MLETVDKLEEVINSVEITILFLLWYSLEVINEKIFVILNKLWILNKVWNKLWIFHTWLEILIFFIFVIYFFFNHIECETSLFSWQYFSLKTSLLFNTFLKALKRFNKAQRQLVGVRMTLVYYWCFKVMSRDTTRSELVKLNCKRSIVNFYSLRIITWQSLLNLVHQYSSKVSISY